MTFTEELYRG